MQNRNSNPLLRGAGRVAGIAWKFSKKAPFLAVYMQCMEGNCRTSVTRVCYAGAELDILLMHEGKRYGFDRGLTDTPRPTRSMQIALHDLKLHRLFVVYPGPATFALSRTTAALGIADMPR